MNSVIQASIGMAVLGADITLLIPTAFAAGGTRTAGSANRDRSDSGLRSHSLTLGVHYARVARPDSGSRAFGSCLRGGGACHGWRRLWRRCAFGSTAAPRHGGRAGRFLSAPG